jgi:hypothetical protein
MNLPRAASSAYFVLPKFAKGDLEEIMKAMRPHDIGEIATDAALPFFPFPHDVGYADAEMGDIPGGIAKA